MKYQTLVALASLAGCMAAPVPRQDSTTVADSTDPVGSFQTNTTAPTLQEAITFFSSCTEGAYWKRVSTNAVTSSAYHVRGVSVNLMDAIKSYKDSKSTLPLHITAVELFVDADSVFSTCQQYSWCKSTTSTTRSLDLGNVPIQVVANQLRTKSTTSNRKVEVLSDASHWSFSDGVRQNRPNFGLCWKSKSGKQACFDTFIDTKAEKIVTHSGTTSMPLPYDDLQPFLMYACLRNNQVRSWAVPQVAPLTRRQDIVSTHAKIQVIAQAFHRRLLRGAQYSSAVLYGIMGSFQSLLSDPSFSDSQSFVPLAADDVFRTQVTQYAKQAVLYANNIAAVQNLQNQQDSRWMSLESARGDVNKLAELGKFDLNQIENDLASTDETLEAYRLQIEEARAETKKASELFASKLGGKTREEAIDGLLAMGESLSGLAGKPSPMDIVEAIGGAFFEAEKMRARLTQIEDINKVLRTQTAAIDDIFNQSLALDPEIGWNVDWVLDTDTRKKLVTLADAMKPDTLAVQLVEWDRFMTEFPNMFASGVTKDTQGRIEYQAAILKMGVLGKAYTQARISKARLIQDFAWNKYQALLVKQESDRMNKLVTDMDKQILADAELVNVAQVQELKVKDGLLDALDRMCRALYFATLSPCKVESSLTLDMPLAQFANVAMKIAQDSDWSMTSHGGTTWQTRSRLRVRITDEDTLKTFREFNRTTIPRSVIEKQLAQHEVGYGAMCTTKLNVKVVGAKNFDNTPADVSDHYRLLMLTMRQGSTNIKRSPNTKSQVFFAAPSEQIANMYDMSKKQWFMEGVIYGENGQARQDRYYCPSPFSDLVISMPTKSVDYNHWTDLSGVTAIEVEFDIMGIPIV